MLKAIKIIAIVLLVIFILLVALFFIGKYRLNHTKDEKDLEATLDKQAAKYLADGKTYALVIGVVKDGKSMIKGYGTNEQGKQLPPDSAATFELASTSKLFTTSLLQLMVDEGQLSLDDKIQTLLPANIKLPPIAQQTTLRHLATHLSGFPSLPDSFIAKMTDETNPYKDLVIDDIYNYLKTCEGKQPDGTFEYSNFGMGLLGHILALKAGVPYEQLVKQKLLDPLGMKQTFVTIDSTNKQYIVQGFDEAGNPNPIWIDHVLTGAGSFLSNGSDMIKFVQANLNANNSALSGSLIKTHQQQLDGETGLGWILPAGFDKYQGSNDVVWHNGMAGGYSSYLMVDKTNQNGLFILSNKAIDVSMLGMRLSRLVRTQSWKD